MLLRALSLQEPWIFAILSLGKTVENRIWQTHVRGRIVLHASKRWDEAGEAWLKEQGYDLPPRESFTLGALVGEVRIEGCRRATDQERLGTGVDPWAFGPWCFVLGNRKRYAQPIPARGYPGFFWVEIACDD